MGAKKINIEQTTEKNCCKYSKINIQLLKMQIILRKIFKLILLDIH